jgi:hypothetical protein
MHQRRGIHQIREIDVDGDRVVIYRLLGQIDGRGYFGEICLRRGDAENDHQILFTPHNSLPEGAVRGYNALNYAEHDDFCKSVTFGIYYALVNHEALEAELSGTIAVLHIGESPVDTTLDTLAYTAALATWRLLGIQATHEPYIERHQIHFPGVQPNIVT